MSDQLHGWLDRWKNATGPIRRHNLSDPKQPINDEAPQWQTAEEHFKARDERRVVYSITVVAGMIPGEPTAKYTRAWHITHAMENAAASDEKNYQSLDLTNAANGYARHLQSTGINWVRLDFVFY